MQKSKYLFYKTFLILICSYKRFNCKNCSFSINRYIELGNFGGKNSEPHKAAVTGDTVGDPFKDTAGPSLHVVIKLLSTTILVAGPLFVASSSTA